MNSISGNHGAGFYASALNDTISHTVLLEDCLFRDNIASNFTGAAATLMRTTSTGYVQRCTFVGNQAYHCGGVAGLGTLLVSDSAFISNRSMKAAGAVGNAPGAIFLTEGSVDRCRFINNYGALDGGAISVVGTATIRNSLFVGNEAGRWGGAIYIDAASPPYPQVQNCTIVYNAATVGGGIWFESSGGATNIICSSNSASSSTNIYYKGNNIGKVGYSCLGEMPPIGGHNMGGNFAANPLLRAEGTGMGTNHLLGASYELADQSPCLNMGINIDWMASAADLVGQSRIQGETVDIGAYEYNRYLSAVFIQIL